MKEIWTKFKNLPAISLIILAVVLEIIAKLIESYFPNISMGLQVTTFVVFFYGIIKIF